MSGCKTELKWFDITEYDKEQDYLRRMHAKGWHLKSISFPGLYRFEACEPEDVVYQLDYNQEGISHKAEYVRMFEDCGWEYLMDFVGYSYFRKSLSEMNGKEEEIFCDDESRLAMMERVFKRRMIPLLVIFFCIIIPQLFMQLALGNPENYVLAAVFTLMLVLYLGIFIKFAVRFRELKK